MIIDELHEYLHIFISYLFLFISIDRRTFIESLLVCIRLYFFVFRNVLQLIHIVKITIVPFQLICIPNPYQN